MKQVVIALAMMAGSALAGPLAPVPPMGWMSWERFRCETDCVAYPDACIDENLYRNMTVRLADDGYLAAGTNRMINVI
jgi:alpha-N-acetylgalactosaminidase